MASLHDCQLKQQFIWLRHEKHKIVDHKNAPNTVKILPDYSVHHDIPTSFTSSSIFLHSMLVPFLHKSLLITSLLHAPSARATGPHSIRASTAYKRATK